MSSRLKRRQKSKQQSGKPKQSSANWMQRVGNEQHVPYWKTLVPVLVPMVGRLKCMLKCIMVVMVFVASFSTPRILLQEYLSHQKITTLEMAGKVCG